jgi:hypothetical protein
MLIAGRLKFVVLRGSKFRYRSARLVSFRLDTKLTEDDDPAPDQERRKSASVSRSTAASPWPWAAAASR